MRPFRHPSGLLRFPLTILGVLGLALSVASPMMAVSSTVVISEFRVRGPSGGSDEFVELYNLSSAPVDIGGWKVRGSNATGFVSTRATIGAGTILNPGCHFLLTNSSLSGGPYSGSVPGNQTYGTGITDDGGIAVTLPDDTIVDAVGMSAGSAFKEGTPLASLGSSNLNRGYERRPGGASGSGTDTDNNSADFQLITPSDPQNLSSACIVIGNPSGVGSADPDSLPAGDTTLLTVVVTPGTNPTSTGLQVRGDLTSIGGSATQPFFDDGSNGDATAGDNTFSYSATVAPATSPGSKSLPILITDAQLRSGSTTISLTVEPPLTPIHDIQGSGSASPFAGQLVATRGVVTGRKSNGYFIQTAMGFEDADSTTSEGIFVFTGSVPPAAAAVGNEVKVTGTVVEFIPASDPASPPLTEIGQSPTTTLVTTANPLPAAITLTAADTAPSGSIEQLERYEGMRVHVAALLAVAPTMGSISEATATATSNGVFYGVIPTLARPFREPGIQVPDPLPPGAPCCVPRFDANPERLRVDSDGLTGGFQIDVTTGATVTGITGPLDYAFRTYTLLPDPPPAAPPVASGNMSATPLPAPGAGEVTVGSFNLQRFYDTVNDPATSDVALTPAAFANRLHKASLAIRNVLRSPDILGVVEVENLSTLQALAAKINADAVAAGEPDPAYQAYLVEGNDIGGIDVGFLVKSSGVTVHEVTQFGKDATFINPNTGTPELLNDRPPLLIRASIQPSCGSAIGLTVIANHLRSLNGVDDPVDGNRVRTKRQKQAEFLADLVQDRQLADPAERLILVGDFNAFEFNDGYVDSIGTIRGTPTPPDQVVLASSDLVSPDLTNLVSLLSAEERYSYSFDGNAQTLDHALVDQDLLGLLRAFRLARLGADFPEVFRNDPTRPERLSDHDAFLTYFASNAAPVIGGLSADPDELFPPNHKMVQVSVDYTATDDCDPAPVCALSVSSNEPVDGTGDGDTAPDWEVLDPHHVRLRAERSPHGDGRVYTVTVTCTDARGASSSGNVEVSVAQTRR